MAKFESDQIVNSYRLYVWLIMSRGLVKGRIFFHKKKEIGGACSKLWGEVCTGFGGQTWRKRL